MRKEWTLKGLQAGALAALILTLWSLVSAMGPLDKLETSGFFYVLIAFGVLGLPVMLYAIGLGLVAGVWRAFVAKMSGDEVSEEALAKSLQNSEVDLKLASFLWTAPVLIGFVGVLVAGVHLKVTSSFQRASFQAIGLALVAVGTSAALVALSPLVLEGVQKILSKLMSDSKGRLTKATLAAGLALIIVGVIGAHIYISGLNIWSGTTLWMFDFFVLGPLLILLALSKVKVERVALKWGIPGAALVLGLICFAGSWDWSSQERTMRAALDKEHSALLWVATSNLQRFGDNDKDGVPGQMGGADCNDFDATVFPGAKDIPENNIDEDCDGKDAQKPGLENHPSRRLVARAIKAASKQAKKAQGDSGAGTKLPEPPKNLILILVDTLRPDHLGFHGYTRPTSPNLDALAKESTVFLDAYATAPHTPRSIPSIFFSRYASHMKWKGAQYNYPKAKPENLSLFEVMQEKGWKNFGVSSHFYFEPKRGMGQGFESWDNKGAGTIAESNVDIAAPRIWSRLQPKIGELAGMKEPFGLFVHFFEPHAKWIGHAEHDFGKGNTPAERHINNYDSEIAFVDTYVGKVVAELKAKGIYDNSIIVVTSDHGEAFGDHGLFFHGQNLYNEVIRVPLLIRVPGWKGKRIEGPVSLVDIAPTLLDLWDITAPADFEGYSLADSVREGSKPELRPVISELLPYTNWKEHHKSLIYGDQKFVRVITKGQQMLYDIKADPLEKNNLVRSDTESAKSMRQKLDSWMSAE